MEHQPDPRVSVSVHGVRSESHQHKGNTWCAIDLEFEMGKLFLFNRSYIELGCQAQGQMGPEFINMDTCSGLS